MKKLLIVSSWAPPMPGGPQNMYNIFSQFSRDSFAIVTSRDSLQGMQQLKIVGNWLPCEYYYFEKQALPPIPQATEHLMRKNSSLGKLAGIAQSIPYAGPRMYDIMATVRLIMEYARSTVAAVRSSGAASLLGISDKGPALIATYIAHRWTRLPYAIHLYDLYRGNNIAGFLGFLARWLERPLLTNARLVILTNEGTEQFYKKRYGRHIRTAVLHNATYGKPYEKIRAPYKPKPPYKIVFTGHVYWPQEGAVLNLIHAMEHLADLPVILELYIPNPPALITQAVAGKKNIMLGSAPQSEMPRIQNAATLLFLPFAWDTVSPDIIATATPGKFTDYLASGRPILVHAPVYAYVTQYVKEHDLGIVVDTNDVQILADKIHTFLANPTRGDGYIQRSLAIFAQNHEATKNAKKMQSLLNCTFADDNAY